MRLYEFADDGRLQSIAQAGVAEHRPGGWLLRDVLRTTFADKSVTQQHVAEERWDSKLDAAALAASIDRAALPAVRASCAAASPTASATRWMPASSRSTTGGAGSIRSTCWRCAWRRCRSRSARCAAAALGKRLFIGIVFALGFWLLQTQFVKLAGVLQVRLPHRLPAAAGGDAGGVGVAVPAQVGLGLRGAGFASRTMPRAAGAVVPGQPLAIHPRPPEPQSRQQQRQRCRRRSAAAAPCASGRPPSAATTRRRHGRMPRVCPPRRQLATA